MPISTHPPLHFIMAAVHGPSIASHPSGFQPHNSRMAFHPQPAQPTVRIIVNASFSSFLSHFCLGSSTAQATSGSLKTRSLLWAREYGSPVCSVYHAFVCVSRVPSNVFGFKYETTVFHRLRSPQDQASLLGYVCGPRPPTASESPLSHCSWIVWPSPLPLSFHDRIKGDMR